MSANFSNSLKNIPTVHKLLKELKAKRTTYNSNNDWGFGGLYGDQYKLPNGDVVIIANACFRHIDGHKVVQYRELEEEEYYKTIIDSSTDTTELITKLENLKIK